MKLLYRRCAGIDVHQKSVSVCVRRRVKGQPNVEREEAVFGTFTQDLERLGQWLKERKVTQVAMESTGVYWIPVWNVLEQAKWKLSLLLVNPMTVRALRGQKTDRIDARRLAEFLQYGLLKGSFIPPKPVRQLRDLTRLRAHLQQGPQPRHKPHRAPAGDGQHQAGRCGVTHCREERPRHIAAAGGRIAGCREAVPTGAGTPEEESSRSDSGAGRKAG